MTASQIIATLDIEFTASDADVEVRDYLRQAATARAAGDNVLAYEMSGKAVVWGCVRDMLRRSGR